MGDVQRVDTWQPDYERGCDVCGLKPVVRGLRDGRAVTTSNLCGHCHFGDSEMVDPSLWNGDDEAGGDNA